PCGGAPNSKALSKKPERSFACSSLMPSTRKRRVLHPFFLDREVAPGGFVALVDKVVPLGIHPRGVRPHRAQDLSAAGGARGRCERVMVGRAAFLFLVPDERWEVQHPGDLEVVGAGLERRGDPFVRARLLPLASRLVFFLFLLAEGFEPSRVSLPRRADQLQR